MLRFKAQSIVKAGDHEIQGENLHKFILDVPFEIDKIASLVKARTKRGSRFSIIVVAEGAKPKGGKVVVKSMVKESTIAERLGGISMVLGRQIEDLTGIETRAVIMGHLLRGGSPTSTDRVLATQLGTAAAEFVIKKKFGIMAGVKGNSIVAVSLKEVAKGPKHVKANNQLVCAARCVGTSFGD